MASYTRCRFYISIIDDYSKYLWLFPLQSNSDVSTIFLAFLNHVTNFFSFKVASIQSNWGGEFRPLHKILQSHGINHRITCPYSHPQNGSIERRHSHIIEIGLALMAHASIPQNIWTEAFQTAVFLINQMPTLILENISPFQAIFNNSPNYNFMCTFGCFCWPNLRPFNHHKFDL